MRTDFHRGCLAAAREMSGEHGLSRATHRPVCLPAPKNKTRHQPHANDDDDGDHDGHGGGHGGDHGGGRGALCSPARPAHAAASPNDPRTRHHRLQSPSCRCQHCCNPLPLAAHAVAPSPHSCRCARANRSRCQWRCARAWSGGGAVASPVTADETLVATRCRRGLQTR